jgi:hypothetical protein
MLNKDMHNDENKLDAPCTLPVFTSSYKQTHMEHQHKPLNISWPLSPFRIMCTINEGKHYAAALAQPHNYTNTPQGGE